MLIRPNAWTVAAQFCLVALAALVLVAAVTVSSMRWAGVGVVTRTGDCVQKARWLVGAVERVQSLAPRDVPGRVVVIGDCMSWPAARTVVSYQFTAADPAKACAEMRTQFMEAYGAGWAPMRERYPSGEPGDVCYESSAISQPPIGQRWARFEVSSDGTAVIEFEIPGAGE